MSINIGLDIGAVSLKLAAMGDSGDQEMLSSLTSHNDTFFAAQFPSGSEMAGHPLVLSQYRRIQGSPIQSTFDLLKELYENVPEESVEGIRVTGSGSQLIAKILGIYFENEFRAIAKGMRVFYPGVRTVFEMGGEASKYLRLDRYVQDQVPGHRGLLDQRRLRGGHGFVHRPAGDAPAATRSSKLDRPRAEPVARRASPDAARCSPRPT